MPAVLAHWVVAREVAKRFIYSIKGGYSFFQGSIGDQYKEDKKVKISKYLYLGASGPDIPYFYDADLGGKIKGTVGKSEYADIFHYNKQAEFILQLVIVAKNTKDRARQQRTMSYALGHTTHLAADSVVHPYVNCYAGAYHSQSFKDIHQISEVHQDSWLAQKYFEKKYIDEEDSLTHYLPDCLQIGWPIAITVVNDKAQEVFSDIVTAFKNTHGRGPDLEYMKDSYETFYDVVINEGYDKALGVIPKKPHMSLVHHKMLKIKKVNYTDLLCKEAVEEAEKACQAVITLYDSELSEDDKNKFRSEVKNWNMDTGYWIDVTLEDNKLKIFWRHRWC